MQAAVARGRTAHRAAAALRCAVDALPRNPAAAGSRLPAVRTRPPVPGLHRLRRVLRQRLTSAARAGANPVAILWERLQPRAFSGTRCPELAADAAPTTSSRRERKCRRPPLRLALDIVPKPALEATHHK